MIKKQIINDTLFLGSNLSEIEPLWLSTYNWGGHLEELRDFGCPDEFSFFSCNIDSYFKARAMAFSNNWEIFFPESNKIKIKGGVWELAKEKAKQEYNMFESENFIIYYPAAAGELYGTGYLIKNSYEESNDLNEVLNQEEECVIN